MAAPPIAMLPPELLRDIFSLVARTAEWRLTTLKLSQVSQGFRRTVLDMSQLFTHADWDDWAPPLVDLWCQRARSQPLTVRLYPSTLDHLSTGKDPERQALLESHSRRWGTLDLCVQLWDRSVIGLVERLLQCVCPALHTLSLSGSNPPHDIPLHLRLDNPSFTSNTASVRGSSSFLSIPCVGDRSRISIQGLARLATLPRCCVTSGNWFSLMSGSLTLEHPECLSARAQTLRNSGHSGIPIFHDDDFWQSLNKKS